MTIRYRTLSPSGDYSFGKSQFLIDSAAAVAQAILTRLKLFAGEWFLDLSAGTPWFQQIVGRHSGGPPQPGQASTTLALYDIALKTVILNTLGVQQLVSYSSQFDGNARSLGVQATVQTIFSTIPINIAVPLLFPGQFTIGLTPLSGSGAQGDQGGFFVVGSSLLGGPDVLAP